MRDSLIKIFIVAIFFFYATQNSYAIYDDVRSPIDYSGDRCTTGDFKFSPSASDNPDINWQLDNPVCISFIALQGALIMAAGMTVRFICIPTNVYGREATVREAVEEAPPDAPIINSLTVYKLASRAGRCASRTYENALAISTQAAACVPIGPSCPAAAAQVPLAAADQTKCCSAYAAYAAAVGAGMSALAIIYASAKGAYENGRVCGHDWNSWAQVDDNGDIDSALPKVRWRQGKYPGSRQYCIEDIFIGHDDPANPASGTIYNSCGYAPAVNINDLLNGNTAKIVPVNTISIKNQYYREYLYGGKEFEDNGSSACKNPSSWNSAKRERILGYDSDNQRYYMTGPGVASNYACQRFVLQSNNDPAAKAAYDCCKYKSQNTICVENKRSVGGEYMHGFCELGKRCSVDSIFFEPYVSKQSSNFICAKTFSVCPYNHLLGGGTEAAQYKLDARGKPSFDLENFCQYRKHCVKVPILPYIRINTLEGAYISRACKDMLGDSQNVYEYNFGFLPIQNRGFSAPLVQCFKETLENMMLNKAGDTKCRAAEEVAENGICTSGYFYKRGEPLDQGSFFARLQNALRGVIKMTLTLSVAFMGALILLGNKEVNKKEMLSYIMKIALIMYFALGEGWQFNFINGILSSGNFLSQLVTRFDYSELPENSRDGCQFPRFNYADSNPTTKYSNKQYPPGQEYLAIWDTLDCKVARALGFGPEVSVPNLAKMIFAGFLTGGAGIIFLIATFMLAFFMIALTVRAMHIFLMSVVAIIILIYISPVTITLSLFERTKGIFSGWLNQILSISLHPVILFAYLGIYVSMFDNMIVGKAHFSGDGKSVPKSIVCDSAEAKNGSIYCIFRIAELKTYSGLEAIGIGLPMLTSINQDKINTLIKAAFLMFIFTGFIDKISDFASNLVGGGLSSNSTTGMQMAQKTMGALNAIQERGTRGAHKAGFNLAKKAAQKVREGQFLRGYQGKATQQIQKKDPGDSTEAPKDKTETAPTRTGDEFISGAAKPDATTEAPKPSVTVGDGASFSAASKKDDMLF